MSLIQKLARITERSPDRPPGEADLRRWPFLTLILVGVSISVPFFAFGAQLGQRQTFDLLVPAILIASMLLGGWGIVTGYVGFRTRLPTALLIKRTFGSRGSLVIVAMMALISFGWFGLQTQILARSVNAILESQFGFRANEAVVIVLMGSLISTTAIIGVRAMGKVAMISVPLLLLCTLVPLAIGLSDRGAGTLLLPRELIEPLSFGMIISVVVGAEVFSCAINPDLSRFLRTARDNAIAMFINYGVAFPALLILAASLGIIFSTADLVTTMQVAGITLPGLFVIILATWTSNDKNLYASGLSLSALFPKVERWQLAATAGALGTLAAMANILDNFITWLIFMGLLVAPMSGTYVLDFFLNRSRYQEESRPPRFRAGTLTAWLAGVSVGLMSLPRYNYGLELFELTRVPTVDALLAAMLMLLLITLIRRATSKQETGLTRQESGAGAAPAAE